MPSGVYINKNSTDSAEPTTDKNKNIFSFSHSKNTSPIHYIYISKNSTNSSEKNTGTNIVLFGTKSNVKALSNINSFGAGKSITGTGNITEARKIHTDNIYVIKILNFLHDFGVGKIRVVKLANTSYVVMKKNVYRKAICFIVSGNSLYEQLTRIKKRIEKIKKVIKKIIKNNIVYTSSLYTVRYKL